MKEIAGKEKLDLWKDAGLFRQTDPKKAGILGKELEEFALQTGEELFHKGDSSDSAYLVLTGCIEIVDEENNEIIGVMRSGEPVGELHLLTGGRRTACARAQEPSRLIRLRRSTFESTAEEFPEVITEMEELIRCRLRHYRLETVLPRLFGSLPRDVLDEIERVADWIRLSRSEYLFRQGENDQTLCVLMHGRLQAEVETAEGRHVVGQIFPGESVGEMALFTGEPRSAHVCAARDSEAILLSPQIFRGIVSSHPEIVMEITRIIIRRLHRSITSEPSSNGATNIAVLPASPDLLLDDFTKRLSSAMLPSRTLLLSSSVVDDLLDSEGTANIPDDNPNSMRLEIWLDEQETAYDYVIYKPDPYISPWTWRCVRRADRILLAGDADASPKQGKLEKTLLSGNDTNPPPASLILLHSDHDSLPGGTREWLSCRSVEGCTHIRSGFEADYKRLARLLTGRAVTVVLSGGGAKGFAHIGVLQALKEKGIPVDMIGGTSMGSVVASGFAMGSEPRELGSSIKSLFAKHRPFNEYTLPFASILRGRRLDDMLREQLGDTKIEDLWTGYFCVAADLTAAEAHIHRSGQLSTAVRSSISLPGILPPVIFGDRLLVDGGVVNNLPGDVMRSLCRGTLIAVDVAPKRDVEVPKGCTEYPSAWEIFRNRLKPRSARRNIPTIPNIMFRTTMLSSVHRVDIVKAAADYYLRPPVDEFGMLQFESIDEIIDVGYRYAREFLKDWPEVSGGIECL